MLLETFPELVRDPAHWQFELLVGLIEMVVFDVVVGAFVWPLIRKHFHRDIEDASRKASGGWHVSVTDRHDADCEHSD